MTDVKESQIDISLISVKWVLIALPEVEIGSQCINTLKILSGLKMFRGQRREMGERCDKCDGSEMESVSSLGRDWAMLGMGVSGSWDVMVGVRSLSGSPSPWSPCDVCCKALGAFNDHNVLTHLMRIKTWPCCKLLFLILHSATSQQSSTPLATRH